MLLIIGRTFDSYFVFDSDDGSVECHEMEKVVNWVKKGSTVRNASLCYDRLNFSMSRTNIDGIPALLEVGKDCLTYFGMGRGGRPVFYMWLDGRAYFEPMYDRRGIGVVSFGERDFVYREDEEYYVFGPEGIFIQHQIVLGAGRTMSRDSFKRNINKYVLLD